MSEYWDIVVWVIVLFGLLFFTVAVFALYWAAKNGQFESFDKGARTIFDEEEPEGIQNDAFPSKSRRKPQHNPKSAQ